MTNLNEFASRIQTTYDEESGELELTWDETDPELEFLNDWTEDDWVIALEQACKSDQDESNKI